MSYLFLLFLTFRISQGSLRWHDKYNNQQWPCCKFTVKSNSERMWNSVNTAKVMPKTRVACFLTHSVYAHGNLGGVTGEWQLTGQLAKQTVYIQPDSDASALEGHNLCRFWTLEYKTTGEADCVHWTSWCPRSICIMDLPALQTISFFMVMDSSTCEQVHADTRMSSPV